MTASVSLPCPRIVRLFAAALHGDACARRDLEHLAPWDPVAAEALCALVLSEVDELERGGALPVTTLAQADQITAAVHERLMNDERAPQSG